MDFPVIDKEKLHTSCFSLLMLNIYFRVTVSGKCGCVLLRSSSILFALLYSLC